ncbi:hypothetical protein [Micromonospora sp. WMMD1082]|uniref:hypothetical protein n=1 Tax=Micromonospora sp. WMMD1082 TaxID=3016104 RepID=UPI002416A598|nr:hypothetical protein [Micromonospora sp. WMMD1082]MDG4795089.1 hypothetical protein [Micromonospora sp. WMMD1082]
MTHDTHTIETGLRAAGEAYEAAGTAARAAQAEIGYWLRANQAAENPLPLDRADPLHGLSRPTANLARDNPDLWEKIADAAAAVIEDGDSDDHRRLGQYMPRLYGWYCAITYLSSLRTAGEPFDPWDITGGSEPSAGENALWARYRAAVAALAEGHPDWVNGYLAVRDAPVDSEPA